MVRQEPTQPANENLDGYDPKLDAPQARSKRRSWGWRLVRLGLQLGAALLVVALLLAGAAWVFGPELARAEVEDRLNTITGRLGYGVTFRQLEVVDPHSVILRDVRVERPEALRVAATEPLAEIPRIEVTIDIVHAILESPRVTDVALISPRLHLVRLADGQTDLDPVLERLLGRDAPASGGAKGGKRKPLPESLRLVGGSIQIDDRLEPDRAADALLGGPAAKLRSPVTRLHEVTMNLALPGGRAGADASIELSALADLAFDGLTARSRSSRLKVRLGQRAPDAESTPRWALDASFEPPLEVGGLPEAPLVSASVGGVSVSLPGALTVTDVTARVQGEPLIEAERVQVEVAELTTDLAKLAVRQVALVKPRVTLTTLPGEHMTPRRLAERLLTGRVSPEVPGEVKRAGRDKKSDRKRRDRKGRRDEVREDAAGEQRDEARLRELTRALQHAPERVVIEDGALSWTMRREEGEPVLWEFAAIRGELVHELLDHRLRADLTFSPGAAQELQVRGAYGYESKSVELDLRFAQVDVAAPLHRLKPEYKDMFRAGLLRGRLTLRRDRPGGPVVATSDLAIQGAGFHHKMVASEPLEGVDASVAGRLEWDPESGDLRLRKLRLGLEDTVVVEGAVGVYGIGHGDKRAPVDLKRVKLSFSMEPTPAQAIFDAVPHGLRNSLDGMTFAGTVGFSISTDVDARRIRHMTTESEFDLKGFDIVAYNDHANPRRLLGTFKHTKTQPVTDYRFSISEDGPMWTKLTSVSPYVVKAIRTNEDGSFYSHKGFHWASVRHSIEQNIRQRRYVRGASTVSMQLVKNIFLSSEKTMARKLQEALLTWAMEVAEDIPKNRIMEVYLNVIEWGPHVYGIRAAAWHYFRKRPRTLSLGESVFLISILPGPRKYHAYYEKGYIGNGWWSRMQRLMEIMVDRRHITEEEYEEAIEKRPWFRRHGPDTPPVPGDEEAVEEEVAVPDEGEASDDAELDWPDAFEGEPGHYED